METALVTGATGGIGRLLVERLLERGYRVVGVARDEGKLRKLRDELLSFEYIIADLSKEDFSDKVLEALERLGVERVDLLVNNAGFAVRKPLLEHSREELENLFRVNAFAPIELTKALTPMLPKGSTVVFVISGVTFINVPELPSYCAAKAALHYLTINLERELEARGIHVMRVYPKQVKTDFWNGRVPKGSVEPQKVVDAILRGLDRGKREVFVPGYLKLVKYLPNWPVFTYRFRY
ncbi:SDR family NAD(P)-dependent oxidoreductase [Thermococcus waiotapuensis]|uniref:SDR family NAD(P)-dependent oxidoreductase n=1 Tax=Thermococcus waiotapuensis TaxID=90909 RepID=A0AAE4NUY7_9EURY|nr:SDR family NAD(P)-dependent oxidoreductase [Thermococcus waiotapuensis]MDV3103080.1 SDR family NAD(P)-dependent oxidoreductase [Thermococcus waiotapuensis]